MKISGVAALDSLNIASKEKGSDLVNSGPIVLLIKVLRF